MTKTKILVTGGCGYIGSHTIVDLLEQGFDVISVDNLSNADTSALDGIEKITGVRVPNYPIDLVDEAATNRLFTEHPDIKGIIHFAALKAVGESVEQPLRYFKNNLNSLINILDQMAKRDIGHLIFSSSCSVYGNAEQLPVTEQTPLKEAESPYARTKQMGEQIIEDFARRYPKLKSILLRYFNPAGAHVSGFIGESPKNKANNLVPVITETGIGKRAEVVVFGNDYQTRDGSCIRDYIHVMDLAHAHTRALFYSMSDEQTNNTEIFNLGIGEGVTVLEAIHAFESVTKQPLNYRIGPRRPGDVVAIYANNEKAAQKLKWTPKRNIQDIMATAWAWEQVK